MVEFRNMITGSVMYVAEERVEEYKAAGHIPAADFQTPTMPPEDPSGSGTLSQAPEAEEKTQAPDEKPDNGRKK